MIQEKLGIKEEQVKHLEQENNLLEKKYYQMRRDLESHGETHTQLVQAQEQ